MSKSSNVEKALLLGLYKAGSSTLKDFAEVQGILKKDISNWRNQVLKKQLSIKEFENILATFVNPDEVTDIIVRVFIIASYDGCLGKTSDWKTLDD